MIQEHQRLIRVRDADDALTCIVCPIGCHLSVEREGESITVSGNQCKRGAAYALEEFSDPRRVVTGTCSISGARINRLSVRSSESVRVDDLAPFLAAMYELRISAPVNRGDVIATNLGGTGIDLNATMTLEAVDG